MGNIIGPFDPTPLERKLKWSSEIPKKTGWYWVKWEPQDVPTKIYITFCPKSEYHDLEEFSVWGYDENDDPESLHTYDAEEAVYSFISE